jgi:DNA-binding GntR family transcriptional regulator
MSNSRRQPTDPAPVESRTNQAYQAIKAEILGNRMRPGEPLPIDRLVRELGLSRTPLREAIQRLEKEGFVEIRPRIGTFVSRLNLGEIQEMYQVRQALEGFAARLAAERVDGAALVPVERALRRHQLEGEIDYQAMSEDGQRLHRLIMEECGNETLAGMLRSLRDHFTRFRLLSLEIPEKILSSHREHLGILEALKERDGSRAETLVREHFEHASQSLLQNLLRRRREPEIEVTI